MGENFRFIARDLDVSDILQEVLDNPNDWEVVSTYKNIAGDLKPYGFLPLVMAVVENEGDNPKDSELLRETTLYPKYKKIREFLKKYNCDKHSRAAFFRLKPGGRVGDHIDDGTYYLDKDRYHLSLQGTYRYKVGDEERIIEPGTFFWFDNKKTHSAINLAGEDRITFVFDLKKNKDNP